MRRTHIIILRLLLACMIAWLPLWVQATPSLHKLDLGELSNNAIICMHQDPQNYLWIGTYDGLNLFNGKDTYVYRVEQQDKHSLCSNIILRIEDAEPGYLWISTSLGFNKFSLKERKVTAVFPGYIDCTRMATNRKGVMLAISREDQISCYMPDLHQIKDLPCYGISPNQVVEIFDRGDGSFLLILTSGEIKQLTPMLNGSALHLETKTLSTHPQGIHAATLEDSQLFIVDGDEQLYLSSLDGKERTWIGNLKGMKAKYGDVVRVAPFHSTLYVVFRLGQIVDLHHPDEPIDVGLGLFWAMPDKRQEILWIGTDGQGIRMLHEKPALFGSILQSDLPIHLQNPIRSLFTDKEGSLWFGTKGDGIVRIANYANYANQPIPQSAVTHYTTADGLTHNRVYCFTGSKFHQCVWIGTEGPGLSCYLQRQQRLITIKQPEKTQPIQNIHRIIEWDDSTLWISSTEQGLYKAHIRLVDGEPTITNLQLFSFLREGNVSKEIQDMVPLNDSVFILGNRGGYGVISFNFLRNSYTFLQKINNDHLAIGDILSVLPATDSTLLIGGSSGLLGAAYRQGKYQIYPIEHNKSNISLMVHGILQEPSGHVWFSTNKGLAKYNLKDQLFTTYQQPIIPVEEFSDDAYWSCPYSGRLFFGGVNGLVWINPRHAPTHDPQTALSIFEIQMDKKSIPFDPSMANEGITVPSDVQSLSFTLAVPDYLNRDHGVFDYQLAGYSRDWIDLQRNNKLIFNNLPTGKYLLHVRYRTDVSVDTQQEVTLVIHVEPPFYRSPLAVICYILLAAVVYGCGLIWWIRKRFQQKQVALAQQLKEEQKEKLYEAKLNFFTHITHELCSPLTLINGVDHYIQRFAESHQDPTLYKYSTILRENVAELNELIQEILDFRKAEDNGFSRAHIEEVSISQLLHKQHQWFQPLAEQQHIHFSCEHPASLTWSTDALYFKKIMTNLLSNAFKYTPEGGEIRLRLSVQEEHLLLSVFNTGKGISEADCQKLFDRYNIIGSTERVNLSGTSRHGLGLFICQSLVQALNGQIQVKSVEGEYVEFLVRLPRLECTEELPNETQSLEDPEAQEKLQEAALEETPMEAPKETLNETRISEATEAETITAKPRVLVIDDHKDIVWLITQTLNAHYTIQQAYQAEEALAQIQQYTPDLIITDLMMPGLSGLELIDRLKQDRFTRHIPVIIVSAKISEKEQAEGLQRGANAYLTKPFSPEVLLSVVDRLVRNQQELKAYFYSPESAYQVSDGQLLHQEDKQFIEEVNDIVKSHIKEEGFGPERIADELHMSSRMFYRRFKRITGTTPSEFIKSYRFNHAAQLLISTNLNVQEIMFEVGMTSKSYFYREFAQKFKLTPGEYRNQSKDSLSADS